MSLETDSKPKRQRTTVERLNLSLLNNSKSNLSADDSINNDDEEIHNSMHLDENSINSESTTTSKTRESNSSIHYLLFRSKIFLAVRNDEGGFFLCQTVNKIYDDSKKCKIQWLEETSEENRFKYGYVDWIDPLTIITKVKVNKVTSDDNYYFEIIKEDLDKVKDMLLKAIQDGGITVEFQSSESDTLSDKDVSKKSNKIEDVELYDKEEDDDEVIKKKSKKSNNDKQSLTSSDSFDSDDTSSDEISKNKKSKLNKSIDKTSLKSPKILKQNTDSVKKKILTNSNEKNKPKIDSSIKQKINENNKSIKTADSAFKKPLKLVNKKKVNDDDTEELESSEEEEKIKKEKPSPKKKDQSPKDTNKKIPVLNGTKSTPLNDNLNNSLIKKRKLMKVVSNRFLDINPKVNVFAKDPFFEEDNESDIPFISPYVQSKLAFKALHLGNIKLLMKLINDLDHVPSVHVSKSVCNKWIPAEYALYLENKDALEILIDNFVDESTGKIKRIQMPENMFKRFSTGVYNPKSLGIRNIRPLTESRSVKEGNNALTKDYEMLDFCLQKRNNLRPFFKLLFNLALEYGVSNELFDFLLAKWQTIDQKIRPSTNFRTNDIYNSSVLFIYENIINAIIFGNRKLAAHILKNAPNGHGFNAVHCEVLNADNDADLKCQLRANMCTKKPFANDLVTPIHCACINPNVKYLKTLLSITQDFNIADKKGRKPVHYAAVCEGLSPLEYLISRVSPYELDSMGSTPLHYACLAGRTANVEMLLSHAKLKQEDDLTITTEILMDNKYGIGGINKPNRRGQLPIHLAISKNNYDCVKVLIKYGCNVEYSLSNAMGKITPLMYAVQLGHQKIVQLLIDNNAKIEARDRHQRTATIHASMCGHSRTLSYLLHLGANPNVCDSSSNSCLHYACAYGWFYCIKVLLDAGALVNVVNDWKLTPFGAAFLKGHIGICDYLLEKYPKQIDINFRTENGETLVMLAVSSLNIFNKGSVDQLDYIVNKLGGNCQLVDSKGCNAFHYLAANAIDIDAIKENLRESGIDIIEQKNLINEHYAEQEKYRNKMADILLKANCNPNVENNEFETPFFTAIVNSNHTFTKFMLTSKNANLKNTALITSKRNLNGKTLLTIMAEKCVEIDTCKIILSSDILNENEIIFNKYRQEFEKMAQITDENSLTPFQIACIKISDNLKSLTSISNPNYKIPDFTIRFIKFLYNECKSNINQEILIEINNAKMYHGTDKLSAQTNKNESIIIDNFDTEFDDNLLSKNLMKINKFFYTTPVFELINDRAVDVIESLVKLMKTNLNKINFDYFDKTGASLLLKSILLKQSKFALKLLDLNCYNIDNILLQTCRNEKYYLNESILQLAIRFNMPNVVEKIFEILTKSNNSKCSLVVQFLKHQNFSKQNFLHNLASVNSNQANVFSRSFLNKIFIQLNNYLNKMSETVKYNNLFLELCNTQDNLGRTPLHICLINFNSSNSNIDLEMFFLETILTFNKTIENEQLKQKIFQQQDVFNRLPLMYLFFDSKNFAQFSLKSVDFYKLNDVNDYLSKNSSSKTIYFGKYNEILQIDPVELLSVILRQMNNKNLDSKDIFGYTTMHYAAIRGSSISCAMLASHGCDVLCQSNSNGNTPLSSAIFYKRETCVLTLLRSCFSEDNKAKLTDYYYLNDIEMNDFNADFEFTINQQNDLKESYLKCQQASEKNLFPIKKFTLYKLIISHKWEGINWLILDQLEKYGLTQLDVIVACLNANEFSLAYRLFSKFSNQEDNNKNFFKKMTEPSLENGRTILHLIANLDLTKSNEKENINQILEILFECESKKQLIDEFITKKDDLGSTAMHYACHMHSFDFIDFILNHLNPSNRSEAVLASYKDSFGQTPYSLLFWQIGRVTYNKKIRDKIKDYSINYLNKNTENMTTDSLSFYLESISKAFFPINGSSFMTYNSKFKERLIRDYPSKNSQQQISPLLYAINRQDFEVCKFLLTDLEFDANASDSNKLCAMVYAIQTNNIRLCQLLLNPSYEIDNENAIKTDKLKLVNNNNVKNAYVQPFAQLRLKQNKKTINEDNNSDFSEEEENNEVIDDYLNEENSLLEQADVLKTNGNFKIKSNIILNFLDNKQRSFFHYLACSLDYGSFSNVEICKLLFNAFNNMDEAKRISTRMPSLTDFLKRVDSNVLSASDYALKNGNILLYEEIQKALNRPTSFDDQKINNFIVIDKFYSNNVPNFTADSELFLKKYLEDESKENKKKESIYDYFKVDPLSNMSKIGSLVWDYKQQVPYDILLTKTDVSYGLYGMHNFYKMQLITQTYNHLNKIDALNGDKESQVKFDENQMCVLFTRWGRIGDSGQYQRTPFSSFREAKDEFCKIFRQKTANDFVETVIEKKKEFENKPKRYNLVNLDIRRRPKLKEINFEIFKPISTDINDPLTINNMFENSLFKNHLSNKDYKEFFVDLLNVNFLKSQINTTHLSADYLPLARLSRESIDKATDILNKKIRPLIEKRLELEKINKKENLSEYMSLLDQVNKFSNEFYELIPQMNYNYEKLLPISTEKQLDEQLYTLNKLNNAQIAIRMLLGAKQSMLLNKTNNPFDYIYRTINAKLELLDPNQIEAKYILRAISSNNDSNQFKIKRIFKFERFNEQERFNKFKLPSQASKFKNRYLLWHGTGTENVISIMCKGLIKAPHDAKWTGQRLGKGIYFSDSFEASNAYSSGCHNQIKSSNSQYCSPERKYMFLCEVALGNIKELRTVHDTIEVLPDGFDSVKLFGKREPDSIGDVTLPYGAVLQLGERIACKLKPGEYRSVNDHQYVVYNEAQVCIRYIIQYNE
jgi:ankyrin repeat protein/predicted DNA-binding WGR domain protein